MTDPIVRFEHVRKAKMNGVPICGRGVRIWFEQRGLSYMEFVRNGYPASLIEAKGDALGDAIAKIAREEAEQS